MKQKHFYILIAVVIISRIPLLFNGFGADGDAWRIARTSLDLWNNGAYRISRIPGFPLYEFLNAPIIGMFGSLGANIATLAVFIVSIFLFKKIIERWNIPHQNIALILYALLPILWKNSALTMDYAWGLCGILASLLCITNRKFVLAGVLLGLAAGARLTHLVFIFPFFFLFDKAERRFFVLFALSAFIGAIICYVPILFSQNFFPLLSDYNHEVRGATLIRRIGFIGYRFIYSFGLLGFVYCGYIIIRAKKKITALKQENFFTVSAVSIITTVFIFCLLPDEREYLIPMMPFVIIALAMLATKTEFIIASALLISYSFISIDVIRHNIVSPSPRLSLQQGFVAKEYIDRKNFSEWREKVSRFSVPDSSFIMIGTGPMFWLENPNAAADELLEAELRQDCSRSLLWNNVFYAYGLNKNQLEEYKRNGFRMYYIDSMKDYLESFIGYKLDDANVKEIRIQ